MTQLLQFLANDLTDLYAVLFRTMWPETENTAIHSFFLMDAEENVSVWVQHEPTLPVTVYNFFLWMITPVPEENPSGDEKDEKEVESPWSEPESPASGQVVPYGAVYEAPAFLDEPLVDPVIPGINFLNNIPFLAGLPNLLPMQFFAPPLFGGLLPAVGLVPAAVQFVHHLHPINPPAIIGAGPALPPGPMPNFWPFQGPPVPNPVPDPALTAGAAADLPANNQYLLLGCAIVVLLAVWKSCQKRETPLEPSAETPAVDLNKIFKISLPEKASSYASNPSSDLSFKFLEISYEEGKPLVKFCGIPFKLSLIPFIVVTGTHSEIITGLFGSLLWSLMRRQIVRFGIKKLAAAYQLFVLHWLKNVRRFIFGLHRPKNVFCFSKQNVLFPKQKGNKIAPLLKPRKRKLYSVKFNDLNLSNPRVPSCKYK